jgi:hypothetical protein
LSWQYGNIIVHALEFTKWATWAKFQHSPTNSKAVAVLNHFYYYSVLKNPQGNKVLMATLMLLWMMSSMLMGV